ncbi:hypothetical protein [Eleftheria terrae]|uniref:hypothetical protein n=1 Tax=Eleftheria terrae TaxID=1597781 RepID=UPI00263B2C27|nr:hypothetical protein [Eleftheria terrae]WKB50524.1 hypothetical protein N7L95_00310 [Eleftheria terrae]
MSREITVKRLMLAAAVLMGAAAPSQASEWGCTVLLCLADPAGPTAQAMCVDPIHRLWDRLRRGHSFPECDEARKPKSPYPDKPSWAERGFSYYDPCPTGTEPLLSGSIGLLASEMPERPRWGGYGATPYQGIGTGDELRPSRDSEMPTKVCVGGYRGTTYVYLPGGDGGSYEASIYDQVIELQATTKPRMINVYITPPESDVPVLWETVRY